MIEEYDRNHVIIPDARCERETDAAILVSAPDLSEDTWIPKSQLSDDSEVFEENTEGDLIITRWLALQKGLE